MIQQNTFEGIWRVLVSRLLCLLCLDEMDTDEGVV